MAQDRRTALPLLSGPRLVIARYRHSLAITYRGNKPCMRDVVIAPVSECGDNYNMVLREMKLKPGSRGSIQSEVDQKC